MASKDLVVRILGDASNFNKALAGIGNSASVAGAKLTKSLTPAAAAVGVAMGSIGSSWNDARDAIIVGTGASGAALDGLIASSKRVAGQVPNDFGQVGQAIADVNTRLGLTGPEMETVSKKALDLSRITGTDLSNNIRSSARVVRDWGLDATEAASVMDLMFAASQQTGIGFDKLGDTVVQFGAPLRQLGFSMEESIALLAGFEAQGVNTETVMSGLRQALSRVARAGEDPIETFRRVTEEIKAAGSAGEANALALELFGARAGPDMAAAIREGRFEIDDLVASLGDSEGSIDSAADSTLRFTDRLAMLRNRVIGFLGPFGEIGGVAGGVVASLGPLLFGLGQLAPALGKARDKFSALNVTARGVGVAVGVGAAALVVFALRAEGARRAAEDLADELRDVEEASDDMAVAEFLESIGAAMEDTGDSTLAAAGAAVTGLDSFKEALESVADTAPAVALRMVELEDSTGGLTDGLIANGASAEAAAEYVDILRAAVEREIVAARQSNAVREDFTEAVDGSGDALEDLTDSTEDATDATEDATDAVAANVAALEEIKAAQDAAREATDRARMATLAAIDSSLGYRNQVADTKAEIAAANEAMANATVGTDEYAQAARDAEGAALAQAAAAVGLANDQAEANGKVLTAQERSNVYRDELIRLRDTLNGDARIAIQMYIDDLNRIPKSINTVATFSGGARPGSSAGGGLGNVVGRFTGGVSAFGETTVTGEHGMEIAEYPPGTRIRTASESARMMSGRGASITNITINAPDGDGRSIARELETVMWKAGAR